MFTLRRRALVAFTLTNAVVAVVAFMAVPLPREWWGDVSGPAALSSSALPATQFDAAVYGLRADDRSTRLTALRVLGALGDRRAVPHLIAFRDSRDDDVSREATLALARITGDPDVVHSLATRAVEHLDSVAAIGASVSPSADSELTALAGPRDPYVRGAALKALAKRSPSAAVPLIHEALASDEPPLRCFALEAALIAGDSSLLDDLRACAASADRLERRLALGALTRTGEPGAEADLIAMSAGGRRDGDRWVEVLAAETLAMAGSAAGPELWRRGVGEMADFDRATAVGRLRKDVPDALRPALQSLLCDRSSAVRVAAALALGAAGDRSASAALRDGAAGDDPLAADALGGDVRADCAVVLASLTAR
ncbi:MAG: HEAT repeat domain-containing protein [Planctomycetes bacterium]|nr:HEAT repeat domain-containing protein [Planctomycetota bacterium]